MGAQRLNVCDLYFEELTGCLSLRAEEIIRESVMNSNPKAIPYINLHERDAPIEFLFSRDGKGLFAKNNLHTIKGREKSGKSAYSLALMAAAMSEGYLDITPQRKGMAILWVDTEQDNSTIRAKGRAVLTMAGITQQPETFKIVGVKGFSSKERFDFIEMAVEENAPDLVFIDGAVDLCAKSFNDEAECIAIVDRLGKIIERYNTTIIAVVHTNKNDKEARGHLGSILQQKSAECYRVEKDFEWHTAKVLQECSRFEPVGALEFCFQDGFKVAPLTDDSEREQAYKEELTEEFKPLFKEDGASIMHTPLVKEYRRLYGKGETIAKKRIAAGVEAGVLEKKKDGRCTYYNLL